MAINHNRKHATLFKAQIAERWTENKPTQKTRRFFKNPNLVGNPRHGNTERFRGATDRCTVELINCCSACVQPFASAQQMLSATEQLPDKCD